MPRLSTVLLIARLALVPTTLAVPAAASEQPAATNADAATASPVVAGMTQEHIKDLFFDAARQGRNDLVGGLIQSGMKPDERDPHGYTALILAAYNGQATTVDLLIQKGANPCATDSKGNSSLMGVAFKGETAIAQAPDRGWLRCQRPQQCRPDGVDDGGAVRTDRCRETAAR